MLGIDNIYNIVTTPKNVIIRCETDFECKKATEILLELGLHHGESGTSQDVISDEAGVWRHPYLNASDVDDDGIKRIEYYSIYLDDDFLRNAGHVIDFDIFYDMFIGAEHSFDMGEDYMNELLEFIGQK